MENDQVRGVFSGSRPAASAGAAETVPAAATAAEVTADFFTNSRRFMGLTGIRGSWGTRARGRADGARRDYTRRSWRRPDGPGTRGEPCPGQRCVREAGVRGAG